MARNHDENVAPVVYHYYLVSYYQIKVTGLGNSKYHYKRPRVTGGGWISQNAFEQADRTAYICSLPLLSKKKCHKISQPIGRENVNDLRNSKWQSFQFHTAIDIEFVFRYRFCIFLVIKSSRVLLPLYTTFFGQILNMLFMHPTPRRIGFGKGV